MRRRRLDVQQVIHRTRQRRVVAQHSELQRHKLGTGFQAQLAAEATTHAAQHGECIHRSAGPVQRRGQQRPATFIERFLLEQRAGRRDGIVKSTRGEADLDPQLVEHTSPRLQARHGCGRVGPMLQIGEGSAPPQQPSVVQMPLCRPRVARHFAFGQLDQPLEPLHVDIVGRHIQAIATRAGPDRVRPERLTESGHRILEHLRPRRRTIAAPHRIRQTVARHEVRSIERERREHPAVATREMADAVDHRRAQDTDAHNRDSSIARRTPRPIRDRRDTDPADDQPISATPHAGGQSWHSTQSPAGTPKIVRSGRRDRSGNTTPTTSPATSPTHDRHGASSDSSYRSPGASDEQQHRAGHIDAGPRLFPPAEPGHSSDPPTNTATLQERHWVRVSPRQDATRVREPAFTDA